MANSNAVEPVQLTGQNVTSEMDAYLLQALYGSSKVLNIGKKLQHEIIDNNTIRVYDGLICHQGYMVRIKPGMYEEFTINNGSQLKRRCDAIVARFTTDGVTEKHELVVIEGTPIADTFDPEKPELVSGDIHSGDVVDEMPLKYVYLNGLSIEKIEDADMVASNLLDLEKGEKVEVIYTGKLTHNQTLKCDFSKYKRIRAYAMLNDLDTQVCELDFGDKTTQIGYQYPYRNVTTSGATDSKVRVFNIEICITGNKDDLLVYFTFHDAGGASQIANNSNTYIYKIEGIY